MTAFVLVPGAWLGAWAFKDVVPHLERAGASAVPVTLTGMGDRAHLASPEVGLETAIEDVLRTIRFRELDEVVLVGHSFAGKVVAGVADRAPIPVPKVVYVDALRPERVRTPQASFDPRREFGPVPPGILGVPLTEEIIDHIGPDVAGTARRRMLELSTPWPIRMATDPLTLSERYDAISEAYVFCRRSGDPVDEIVAGKWGKLDGPYRVLDTGHWPMITDPAGLARGLLELAR